jgi:hypothetical protein
MKREITLKVYSTADEYKVIKVNTAAKDMRTIVKNLIKKGKIVEADTHKIEWKAK